MKLSIVIPAFNEAESLPDTIHLLYKTLYDNQIPHEILVVNDESTDNTEFVLKSMQNEIPTLYYVNNYKWNGFGYAVRKGFEHFTGDCVAVFMADLSDDPNDLVSFYNKLNEGYDCVFGNRFMKGGQTKNYPYVKYILNRIFNNMICLVFRIKYSDTTNAFKLYRREVIEGLKPFLSPHFNLTIELPLKAIVRGFNYAVVPNSWHNRSYGKSNLKIREMGSRYMFIFFYCLIEKSFSRKDYHKDPEKIKRE